MNTIWLFIHDLKMKYYRTRLAIEKEKSRVHQHEVEIWRKHYTRALKWLEKYADECARLKKKVKEAGNTDIQMKAEKQIAKINEKLKF